MAVPRYIFWPFDIESARLDRARTRAKAHIADVLWMGGIGCADHFLEPGKALHTLTVDEEAAAAQD